MTNNYLSNFFSKPESEITKEDLAIFFSERQEESSTIEFKSGEVEITDLFKEVAAFLNTEGGLLIIGSPRECYETVGKTKIRYCKGDLTFSSFVSKDWLQQKIYSNITPSPTNIYIKAFLSEQGNQFILDIPQSNTPPHQSNADGRYYIRIDNEAKPAPHGLVQALFDKRKKPVLKSRLNRKIISQRNDHLEISIINDSATPADKVSFIIDIYNISSPPTNGMFIQRNDELLGKKFTMSQNTNQVLVSVISVGVDFTIDHHNKNYLIAVSYWSKEVDFDMTYFLVDAKNNSITEENWLASNKSLLFDFIESTK